MTVLHRSFYDRDPRVVAPEILGKYLVRRLEDGTILSGAITEVEAYLGEEDPASHAFKGKTTRNASLYKAGGHAYVHTMRHHALLDVVLMPHNIPRSLLIRSIVPEEGRERMQALRKKNTPKGLTDGPGKVCQALAITKEHDGIDITTTDSGLWIEERGVKHPQYSILTTPRIGISKGAEMPLRYVVTSDTLTI